MIIPLIGKVFRKKVYGLKMTNYIGGIKPSELEGVVGSMESIVRSIYWQDDKVVLLDQTRLPLETVFVEIESIEDMWDAIKRLVVRGAPAIGIAGAYGLYLGIRDSREGSFSGFFQELKQQSAYLATSRPTAVNLFWALERMEACAFKNRDRSIEELKGLLLAEAEKIRDQDEAMCRRIGQNGLTLLKNGMTLFTHCNAGSYATARYGTALAPIYLAREKGWNIKVFAGETRPLLQGARLTAHELMAGGIYVTLITDNMVAYVMSKGWIDAVILGCDRIAANGDVANKIGTYGVAVLAKEHGIPFYVAGPTSTIDLSTLTGDAIKIEEREPEEVTERFGQRTAPYGVKVFNPAFDITPHRYITAIITEKGIIRAPFKERLESQVEGDQTRPHFGQ